MKVALVYDRVNKFGGAERLLLALHKIFPEAPLFTLVYNPKTAPWANVFNIKTTFLNSFPFLRNKHEWLAPLAPLAFETLDFSGFDVIISITSSDAKAVITKPGQLHLCYCLTPTRYFWSGSAEYGQDPKLKYLPTFLKKHFQDVDLITSQRPDAYFAISQEISQRIQKFYHQSSKVIYPCIEDKFFAKTIVPTIERNYFLLVGRLVPYKKADLAIKAFNKLNLPLVVVGEGSELNSLKKLAGKNISFVGSVGDDKLIDYYRHAKAVIFPQQEDFGLVPLEAQACGTPVIAFGKGGALETVVSDKTGLFFSEQSENSLIKAVNKFLQTVISPLACQTQAKKFSFATFKTDFTSAVDEVWSKYRRS